MLRNVLSLDTLRLLASFFLIFLLASCGVEDQLASSPGMISQDSGVSQSGSDEGENEDDDLDHEDSDDHRCKSCKDKEKKEKKERSKSFKKGAGKKKSCEHV